MIDCFDGMVVTWSIAPRGQDSVGYNIRAQSRWDRNSRKDDEVVVAEHETGAKDDIVEDGGGPLPDQAQALLPPNPDSCIYCAGVGCPATSSADCCLTEAWFA